MKTIKSSADKTPSNSSKKNSEAVKPKTKPPFPSQKTGVPPGSEKEMNPSPQFLAPQYQGSGKLKGKKALITGGDSGIGRSIAVLFAREGADVAITYVSQELEEKDAKETVQHIENEGVEGFALCFDVSDYQACESAMKKVISKLGGLDILVNNAAFQNHVDSFEDLEISQIRKTFDVNFLGYVNMIKVALPHLQKGSSIINTSSILATEGNKNLVDYSATKAAIHNLTKSLSQGFSEKGIRVNAVAPGPVWTPLNPAERSEDEIKNFGADTFWKRPAQPEEIAPAYVYLASEIMSGYVSGETINIFGNSSGAN